MSSHSKKYLEKVQQLKEKELSLREEIDTENLELDNKLKDLIKIAGIVLVAAGMGYTIYRLISGPDDTVEKKEKKKKKRITGKSKSVPISDDGPVNKLMNRVSEIAITGIVKAVSDYLNKKS